MTDDGGRITDDGVWMVDCGGWRTERGGGLVLDLSCHCLAGRAHPLRALLPCAKGGLCPDSVSLGQSLPDSRRFLQEGREGERQLVGARNGGGRWPPR